MLFPPPGHRGTGMVSGAVTGGGSEPRSAVQGPAKVPRWELPATHGPSQASGGGGGCHEVCRAASRAGGGVGGCDGDSGSQRWMARGAGPGTASCCPDVSPWDPVILRSPTGRGVGGAEPEGAADPPPPPRLRLCPGPG